MYLFLFFLASLYSDEITEIDQASSVTIGETPQRLKLAGQCREHILASISNRSTSVRVSSLFYIDIQQKFPIALRLEFRLYVLNIVFHGCFSFIDKILI